MCSLHFGHYSRVMNQKCDSVYKGKWRHTPIDCSVCLGLIPNRSPMGVVRSDGNRALIFINDAWCFYNGRTDHRRFIQKGLSVYCLSHLTVYGTMKVYNDAVSEDWRKEQKCRFEPRKYWLESSCPSSSTMCCVFIALDCTSPTLLFYNILSLVKRHQRT